MEAGPVGRHGVAVQQVFAREISAFERELAPIPSQVMMENIAMKEKARNKKIA